VLIPGPNDDLDTLTVDKFGDTPLSPYFFSASLRDLLLSFDRNRNSAPSFAKPFISSSRSHHETRLVHYLALTNVSFPVSLTPKGDNGAGPKRESVNLGEWSADLRCEKVRMGVAIQFKTIC
jgi:hypothetical protein